MAAGLQPAAPQARRVSSFRALGATANVWAIESVVEELATLAGQDALAFRLDHLRDECARAVLATVARLHDWQNRTRRDGTGLGIALARSTDSGAWCAVAAEIEASEVVRVRRPWIATDRGAAINPDGAVHQLEGGAIQACSLALKEEVRLDRRSVTSTDRESYPILRFSAGPQVTVKLIDVPQAPPPGAGGCATGPTIAAIANAIHDALGFQPYRLPFTPDDLAADMAHQPAHD